MAINTHPHVRQLLLACFIALIMVTTGCKQQTTTRPLLSADEVRSFSDEFYQLTNMRIQALMERDFEKYRQIFTDDIVHHDLNMELFKGVDNIISIDKYLTSVYPDFQSRLVKTFIGSGDGFYIEDTWNWVPMEYVKNIFSSEHPLKNYMWMTVREGKLSYWWLFYGEEVFPAGNLEFDPKLLQDYAQAWSSEDPQIVSNLYAIDAVRTDGLFGEDQKGSAAIEDYATKLFTWYPGVRFTLVEAFGEFEKPVKRGGVYTISILDGASKPCDIDMIVLLEPDESQQKIAQEWVFYNTDSLIACGWAQ